MQYEPKKQANIINDFYKDSLYIIYTPAHSHLPFLPTGGGYFYSGSGYFVERDNLNMFLILLTVKGAGAVSYRNKTAFLLPGQAVLLNGNEYHKYYTSPAQGKWDFKWIRFHTDYIDTYDTFINGGTMSILSVINTEVESYCDTYLQYLKSKDIKKDINMCSLISQILTSMCEISASENEASFNNRYQDVEDARQFISDNYQKKIRIEELSAGYNLTKFSFIRKFRHHFGITPYSYLQKERINMASLLLETTNISIVQISEDVGYSDQNNFTKYFKSYMGMTPSQYRRQHSG